jgi:hypothetical protein
MENQLQISVFNVPLHEKNLVPTGEGVIFTEEDIPDGAFGEPVTFTLIVTTVAIGVLAAYLLRKHKTETFKEVIEITRPDGTVEKRTVTWTKDSSEGAKTNYIEQVAKAVKELIGIS